MFPTYLDLVYDGGYISRDNVLEVEFWRYEKGIFVTDSRLVLGPIEGYFLFV